MLYRDILANFLTIKIHDLRGRVKFDLPSYFIGVTKLGLLEFLTIVFLVLKVTGIISWSWWIVFIPAYIAATIYVIWISTSLANMYKTNKVIKNLMK